MKDKLTRLQNIFWATLILIGGILTFMDLSKFEAHGDSVRLNIFIIFVYKLLGKWGVLGMFVVTSGCILILPYYSNQKHVREKNQNRTSVLDKKEKER
jgi:hypothetical protein